jgi:hypothetical protein
MTELNRFDYFSDIEDHFVRLRGKALFLSPLDWELIQQWKDDGVPLQIIYAAIQSVFDNHKAKKNRRPIASLSYCKSEVDARFAEWKESRVGAHDESEPGRSATGSNDQDPFSKGAVLDYLERSSIALTKVSTAMADALGEPPAGHPRYVLIATLRGAITRLAELRIDVEDGLNPRSLEEMLTGIEYLLDTAIAEASTPEQIAEARAAVEQICSPHKGQMLPQVYAEQIDKLVKRKLREMFGVPRLSLFHMG